MRIFSSAEKEHEHNGVSKAFVYKARCETCKEIIIHQKRLEFYEMTQFMDAKGENISPSQWGKKKAHKSVRAFNAEIFFPFKVTNFAAKRFSICAFFLPAKFPVETSGDFQKIYYFN